LKKKTHRQPLHRNRFSVLPPREPHDFALTPAPVDASQEERSESAVVLVVLDGVRWQEVFGGADRQLARRKGLDPLVWANARDLVPNVKYSEQDLYTIAELTSQMEVDGHRADIVIQYVTPGSRVDRGAKLFDVLGGKGDVLHTGVTPVDYTLVFTARRLNPAVHVPQSDQQFANLHLFARAMRDIADLCDGDKASQESISYAALDSTFVASTRAMISSRSPTCPSACAGPKSCARQSAPIRTPWRASDAI